MVYTEERTIYCSGPNWDGDGSKESSKCPFDDSMKTTSKRYKCSHCVSKASPSGIHAGPNGIKKMDPANVLETEVPVQKAREKTPPPNPRRQSQVDSPVDLKKVLRPEENPTDAEQVSDAETAKQMSEAVNVVDSQGVHQVDPDPVETPKKKPIKGVKRKSKKRRF